MIAHRACRAFVPGHIHVSGRAIAHRVDQGHHGGCGKIQIHWDLAQFIEHGTARQGDWLQVR
jgi:hypothetical protein